MIDPTIMTTCYTSGTSPPKPASMGSTPKKLLAPPSMVLEPHPSSPGSQRRARLQLSGKAVAFGAIAEAPEAEEAASLSNTAPVATPHTARFRPRPDWLALETITDDA